MLDFRLVKTYFTWQVYPLLSGMVWIVGVAQNSQTRDQPPLISAIMPIKNAEATLSAAIMSVLSQVGVNLELICVVASSSDESLQIALNYAARDSRVRVIDDSISNGIADQCNIGIKESIGEFIAICNADDLNTPNRFLAQSIYLDTNPEYGVVGSDVKTFGKLNNYWRMPSSSGLIKATMLFRGSIANPSAMIRKSVLIENGIRYDPTFRSASEDLDLWERLSRVTKMANLDFPVIWYRISDSQTTYQNASNMLANAKKVRLRQLKSRHCVGKRIFPIDIGNALWYRKVPFPVQMDESDSTENTSKYENQNSFFDETLLSYIRR